MKRINIASAVLAAAASAAGIAFPGLYRDIPWLTAQMKGQDAVTLIAAAVLVIASLSRTRKAAAVSAGINAYMVYTYLFYALEVQLNPLFHLYLAVTVLSLISLIGTLSGLRRFVNSSASKGGTIFAVIYLGFIATVLAVLWNADMISNLKGNPILPNPTEKPIKIVWVFDMSFVIPAIIYTIYLLSRRRAFGVPLCGIVLIKALTMGAALLGMTIGSAAAGFELDIFLAGFWSVLTGGGIAAASLFLKGAELNE